MKIAIRLFLHVDGLISIRFLHFQLKIQRTDWLQKSDLLSTPIFAVPKVKEFSGKKTIQIWIKKFLEPAMFCHLAVLI